MNPPLSNQHLLLFEENQGQMAADRSFRATSSHGIFYIQPGSVSTVIIDKTQNPPIMPPNSEEELTVSGVVLSLSFVEPDDDVIPIGIEPADAKFHYLLGPDAASWHTHVPVYPKVRYPAIWEGIDLDLCGDESGLKLYWHLDSPVRLSSLRLRWDGADSMSIGDDGSLLLTHALGELRDPAPYAWQIVAGEKVPVDCSFSLQGDNEFIFSLLGPYDENLPLVIDPLIPYSTYLGGSVFTITFGIDTDSQGCAYVAGTTLSMDFPVTPGAFQTTYPGNSSAYISKFSPDGSSLIYSTFLGGSGGSGGNGIAVDALGYAYVTGFGRSADFPLTPGAFQTTFQGTSNAFATKLAQDGASLVYSTFLGGDNSDDGADIVTDDQGYAYIIGNTDSTDFPVTPGAFQQTLQGPKNAFISKVAPDGESLSYSTYLGGNVEDYGYSIAIDSQYHAYVTGYTQSTDFPVTPGAFQTTLNGTSDAFVTKLSAGGDSLAYSTYLGGSTNASAHGIAVNAQNIAYIAGITTSADFPVTPEAFQSTISGNNTSAFITALSPDGASLFASTYLGGSDADSGLGIALDAGGRPYVTGSTYSADFPITPNIIPSSYSGGQDAFVSMLSPDLTALLVSYFVGGSGDDYVHDIAVGRSGGVYIVGQTNSTNFPVTPGAFQPAINGFVSGFITRNIIYFLDIHRATLSIVRLS